MTKPIRLLGWKQMKQVVANTSRLNFEISLRLLVCLCLTSRFNRKTTPPCKDAKSSKFECRIQRQKFDRQTDTKTNQRTPTPSFYVRQLFLSFFISFVFFIFSFFLLSFFFFYFSFLLHYFISFRFLSFLLSFFLSF